VSTPSVAIIAGAIILGFIAVLIRLPNAVEAALGRVKSVRIARILAIDLFEDAITEKEEGEVDRSQLKKTVARINSGTILWVDDSPAGNIEEIQALRILGVTIDIATTNEEAGIYLTASAYDLILSDIRRSSTTEDGNFGLKLPDVIKAHRPGTQLAFYVLKREGDTALGDVPVFTKPSDLLVHVVAVLAQPKSQEGS
jgi:CheY-like chemotaxis protein